MQWARRHFLWREADWNMVLFSDESRFALSRHADGRTRNNRRTNERYTDCCVLERIDLVEQFDGSGWDNRWPEDELGCNARLKSSWLLAL